MPDLVSSVPPELVRPDLFDLAGRRINYCGLTIPKVFVRDVGYMHSAALILWCYMQSDKDDDG